MVTDKMSSSGGGLEVDLSRISSATSVSAPSIDDLSWRQNAKIQQLYTAQDLTACLELIEQQLHLTKGQCEFALLVKGKIRRQQGFIHESLQLFQAAAVLNPTNIETLKQVGRSLYLLGKFDAALQLYQQMESGQEHWQISHQKGLCLWRLRRLTEAIECFQLANQIQRHDSTFLMLGRIHVELGQYAEAAAIYSEAIEFSPDNAELLTTLGLLYLRMGETLKAFDYLGNALTRDGHDRRTIMAAASVIQDHNDIEVALIKYRIAAVQNPTSAQLWNNIGLCFYSRSKFVAAISCLKRALYLDPFQWTIAYNLGLTFLKTRQLASAYHYMSTSINLKQDHGSSYMYLAIILYQLDDHDNARAAFQHALHLDGQNLTIRLNYAIVLSKIGDSNGAATEYREFRHRWDQLKDNERNQIAHLQVQMAKLESKLPGV